MHSRSKIMEQVDPDEVKLAEVSKHPIGIILLYVQASVGMTLAVGLSYFLLPLVVTDTDTAFFYGNIFMAIAVTISFVIALIATHIYRENRLVLTDRNITQVLQYGLFNRKVSQLNVNNVEDVTAQQQGVLATMFNFGTLKVETAGEQVNFNFNYCPNPGFYAKIILDAREKMLGQMAPDHVAAPQITLNQNNGTVITAKTMNDAVKDLGAETIKRATSSKE